MNDAEHHRDFAGNPYFFLSPRPIRERRLRAYIVRQHHAGRPVSEIVADAYVRRCGSESFYWQVLQDPRTLQALNRDIHDAIEECAP
jgi:hypothetical protein